jgi:putative transposase
MEKFKSNNNVVYSCKYHVIFCPKYRRKVLVNAIATRLKELLSQIAIEIQGRNNRDGNHARPRT